MRERPDGDAGANASMNAMAGVANDATEHEGISWLPSCLLACLLALSRSG